MRNDIDKKLCHFFMVNQSSLLTLIFIDIAWCFFLLLKFKLLNDDFMKINLKFSKKVRIILLLLALIDVVMKTLMFHPLNYTSLQKVKYLPHRNSDL